MDVFDLYAKISLDTGEYEKELNNASEKSETFGSKLKNTFSTITGVTVGNLISSAVQKLVQLFVNVTKQSMELSAEYEQLVGGVETLFSESSEKVKRYANDAYKTAGLSANEYMDTVTSFSASLLQSLGGDTEKAADYANLAITDMSDNANKMGTSMESIQNAYQGFAKQNYTMLDNLKLGYGGTKEEMQRLLDDAKALKAEHGEMAEYSIDSYADIVDAIHVVQTEMGITGTTAKEASDTISGSVDAMKASWKNLLTGIGTEQDTNQLVENFVNSATTAISNVLPVIGKIIITIIPAIAKTIGSLFLKLLPEPVLNAFSVIKDASDSVVQSIVEFFVVTIPNAIESAVVFFQELPQRILTFLAELPENIGYLLGLALGKLIDWAANCLMTVITETPKIIEKIGQFFAELPGKLWEHLLNGVENLSSFFADLITTASSEGPKVKEKILEFFNELPGKILEIGKNIVTGLWNGIKHSWDNFKNNVSGLFSGFVNGIKAGLGIHSPSKVFASIGGYMAEGLGEGWFDEFGAVKRDIENGMNFKTGQIDFASSGIGISSANIMNGIAETARTGDSQITINLVLPDNTKLAQYLLPSLIRVSNQNGTPIVNPA